MFLYDKRQMRNFRKDDHEWEKKADGRGNKAETHEKLKVAVVSISATGDCLLAGVLESRHEVWVD